MYYTDLFNTLKESFHLNREQVSLDANTLLMTTRFRSPYARFLPDGKDSETPFDRIFEGIYSVRDKFFYNEIDRILKIDDSRIKDNHDFRYPLFTSKGGNAKKGAIIMLHGLNEKDWHKYLPWGYELHKRTGKTVILFPIAFHMNRALPEWSDPRMMAHVSNDRKKLFREIACSSLANAAISTRLQQLPQRFFWSGLMTYLDIMLLIRTIRNGKYRFLDPDASVDLFAYSIGAYLSQILTLSNEDGVFDDSRLFIFCGGSAFNRMTPVSREILDSKANIALYSYYIEHLDIELKKDKRLAAYLNDTKGAGLYFRAMLNQNLLENKREERLKLMSDRIYALLLKNDSVIPPYETINLLQGNDRSIPVKVEIKDPPYPNSHIKPFTENETYAAEVDAFFDEVFGKAASFLK